MTTQRPFSLLSATLCGLALGASVLLAGCGGSSNGNSGGGTNNGGASLAAGQLPGGLSEFSSGTILAGCRNHSIHRQHQAAQSVDRDFDYTGDGSTNSFSGTVSSTGALVTNAVSRESLPKLQRRTFSALPTPRPMELRVC